MANQITAEWLELTKTVEKLTTVNERRQNLIEYRDRQIVSALDAGATWVQVQELVGLSSRGLQLAIARGRAATPAPETAEEKATRLSHRLAPRRAGTEAKR